MTKRRTRIELAGIRTQALPAEIAEATGLSQKTLRNLMARKPHKANKVTQLALARFFNVEPSYLFSTTGKPR